MADNAKWKPDENPVVIRMVDIHDPLDQPGKTGQYGNYWRTTVRLGDGTTATWFIDEKGYQKEAAIRAGLTPNKSFKIWKEDTGERGQRGQRLMRLKIEPVDGEGAPQGRQDAPPAHRAPNAPPVVPSAAEAFRRLTVGSQDYDGVYSELLELATSNLTASLGEGDKPAIAVISAAGQLLTAWIAMGCPLTPREEALRRTPNDQRQDQREYDQRRPNNDDDLPPF
jgi:hypothetical protein